MLKVILVLGLAWVLAAPANAGFFYGAELKRMCDEGFADQYIAGAYDGYETVKEFGELPFDICVPADSRVSDLTRIVCDYVDAEPDAQMSSASVVVAAALVQAYKCP